MLLNSVSYMYHTGKKLHYFIPNLKEKKNGAIHCIY